MNHKAQLRAEGTMNMYRIKMGHLVRVFGEDFQLRRITPVKVDDYITQRSQEGAQRSTIYRETVVLSQVLKAARRAGEWEGDPRALLPLEWAPKYVPRKHHLTPRQLMVLLGGLEEERRAWVAFVVATSARHSEAERSMPEDLNRDEMVCHLRGTKTAGSDREVPVLQQFAPLWDIVGAFWDAHGRGPRWKNASRGLPDAAKRLGLPHTTPNDLRRTHASWLIQSGVDQGLVSRVLGHRDQTMVHRVYGQITSRQLSASVQRQVDEGTKSTQSQFFADLVEDGPAENSSGPLGGMADAGDLKSSRPVQQTSKFPKSHPLKAGENRRSWVGHDTKSTQSFALAAAAHRLGVLHDHVVNRPSIGSIEEVVA